MMARAKDGTPATERGARLFLHAGLSGRARRARLPPSWLIVGVLAAGGGLALGFGCGGSEKTSGVAQSTLPEGVHSETLDHEACSESGHRVETLDSNNDGKADIKRLYDNKTGKEVCRITDLDHDGKPDLYEYYDPNGVLRRREAGYDGSGIVDVIEIYENGKLSKRELDTTGQHRVDTWDYFDTATGKILRRERDSTNDGRIDQWWTYDGDKVTIAMDKNGDGKPDPADTVTIGGSDDSAKAPPPPSMPDAAPAAPAVYVPAGMDAGDLAPPLPAASAAAGAAGAAASDAGAGAATGKAPAAAKPAKNKGGKK
jgi:hypothetical protein